MQSFWQRRTTDDKKRIVAATLVVAGLVAFLLDVFMFHDHIGATLSYALCLASFLPFLFPCVRDARRIVSLVLVVVGFMAFLVDFYIYRNYVGVVIASGLNAVAFFPFLFPLPPVPLPEAGISA